MKLALAAVLMIAIAQMPSCNMSSGENESIVGYVEDKYMAPENVGPQPYILIGGTEHRVPMHFWREVQVGDLVKFENGIWRVLRKVGT